LVDRAKHYHPNAYRFVRQALDYALTELSRVEEARHITGQELLQAISKYAKNRFGPFACRVFEEWGITETLDFGNIVFELVEREVMTRRPEDSLDDFRDGYDFHEEFEVNYDYLSELRSSSSSSSPIISDTED